MFRLPKLRTEAKESLSNVREQLSHLPPPPSENPAGDLLHMITSFCNDVQSLIRGSEAYERLIQKCNPAYKAFKSNIKRTAPQFRPSERNPYEVPRMASKITVDSEDELEDLEAYTISTR